jgi:undecaprenyl-diphosphatase
MPTLDDALFHLLNRTAANPAFDAAFPILTSLHQRSWFLVAVGLAAVAALVRGNRRTRLCVVALIAAVSVSDLTCSRLVKRVVQRERPCQMIARGVPLPNGYMVRVVNPERCPGSQSFPSNHAANMMAAGTVGWWFTPGRKRWVWFLLPLVIGYTRVYLGYHYPSDVIAGWLLGATIAAVTLLPTRMLLRKREADSGSDAL